MPHTLHRIYHEDQKNLFGLLGLSQGPERRLNPTLSHKMREALNFWREGQTQEENKLLFM